MPDSCGSVHCNPSCTLPCWGVQSFTNSEPSYFNCSCTLVPFSRWQYWVCDLGDGLSTATVHLLPWSWPPDDLGDARIQGDWAHHSLRSVDNSRETSLNYKQYKQARNKTTFLIRKSIFLTFYTPEVKLRTYYGMASVRPSVCPSVSHIMSTQYLEKFLSDSHGT